MKQVLLIFFCFISIGTTISQPNCEILKSDADCYEACELAWQAIRYAQGSFKSQELFNKSIEMCPTFAYSYMEKAVPYLKRGQFVEWKELIDKAVELSPIEYLGYRGWCRVQFLRDYEGAIKDIEELKTITRGDIGFCQNGNYHLEIALGLCYKQLGKLEKAKKIFEAYLSSKYYSEALYDYYHLGVIEFQLENLRAAKENFIKQNQTYEIAESHYYLSLIANLQNERKLFNSHIEKAEDLYLDGLSLKDYYCEPNDKIYLIDIQNKRKTEANK